jgi:hypothetical protein
MRKKVTSVILIGMLIISACSFSNSNKNDTEGAGSTESISDKEAVSDSSSEGATDDANSIDAYESLWTTFGISEETIYDNGGMIFYCEEFSDKHLSGKLVNVDSGSQKTAEIQFDDIDVDEDRAKFYFEDEWGNTGKMIVSKSEIVMHITVEEFVLSDNSPREFNMDSDYSLVKVSDVDISGERTKATQAATNEPVSIPEFIRYEDKDTITGSGVDGGEMSFEKNISLAYLSEESEEKFQALADVISQVADEKRAYIKEDEDGFNKEIKEIADGTWQIEHADDIGVVGYPERTVHERTDYIQRVDSEYACILSVEDDYEGQLSVSAYYETYNYNVHTGENIKISDVIPDKEALRYYLVRELLLMEKEYQYSFYPTLSKIDEYIIYDYDGIVEDEYSRGFIWYLDSIGVTIILNPYDVDRNSVWITIPYTSELVSDNYLPFEGQEITSEYNYDHQIWNMNIELGRDIEYYLPVFSEDESVNDIFIQAIKTLESTGYMPNGEYCYGSGGQDYAKEKDVSYRDSVAVCDVTGDGKPELLIRIEGGHTSTISQWIFSYNEERKCFEKLLVDYTMEYFDDGIVKCDFSHGSMYEDDFWPYDLYQYNDQTNEYVYIASVNSKQLLHDYETGELDDELNKDFPYEEDKDKDGKVYDISIDGQVVWMDNAEFEAWQAGYIEESKRISPDWHIIAKTAVIH